MSGAGADSEPHTHPPQRWNLREVFGRFRNDQGVGQALEAMLIGALVLGAIGFAVATQAPPPPSQASGVDDLEEKTWSAIDALDNMHYPNDAYSNRLLSYLVAQAAGGNTEPLQESLSQFMPPGSEFTVYLHNGYDRFPLYENKTTDGPTVGISYPTEPNWKFHYGETDLRLYSSNQTSVAMGHNLIPLFHANHVNDQGKMVKAEVSGVQEWSPGAALGLDSSFDEKSYATFIQGNLTKDYPSASIHMECERVGSPDGVEPCYAIDLTENPQTGYGPPDTLELGEQLEASLLNVTVENKGPGVLPQGTEIELSLPVGLPTYDDSPPTSSDFTDIHVDGADPQPQTVTATLAADLPEDDEATLEVWVERTDDRYAYKTIHARLAEGAISSSQFLAVVQDKEEGVYTGGDTRATLISAPRPAGSGDTPDGRWAIVMPSPYGNTTVDEASLELTEDGAYFKDAAFPTDFNPNTGVKDATIDVDEGTTITWTPDSEHDLDAYSFIELQFIVDGECIDPNDATCVSDALIASPNMPLADPQAEFAGYHPPPNLIQIEPGIWWQEHPPDQGDVGSLPGYGAQAEDPDANEIKPIETEDFLRYRNTDLEGTTTYNLANLVDSDLDKSLVQGAPIKDAAQSASMDPSPQRASPGEDVHIEINSQDLALYLSKNFGVNSLDMKTHVYAPWGVIDRTPAKTYEHGLAASVLHDPLAMLTADLDGTGEDLIVGSSDGNVYGIDGEDGEILTGLTFPLDSARPTVLAESSFGQSTVYGIGTNNNGNEWYSMDDEFNERWSATKPEGNVEVLALASGQDLTSDGIPDFVAATKVSNPGLARLIVHDGATGGILHGWSNDTAENDDGVRVSGSPNNVGFANVGPTAEGGIWSDTGVSVGTNVVENVEEEIEDPDSPLDVVFNTSYSVYGAGLEGYSGDGDHVWTLRGTSFKDIERTDAMDLGTSDDGDPWHGIVGAGTDGWAYGLNSSKPVNPVTGWAVGGAAFEFTDVSFSNPMEGYWTSGAYMLYGTDDGLATEKWNSLGDVAEDEDALQAMSLNAVGTPKGPAFSGNGSIAWWGGDAGQILRTTDYSQTVEVLGSTAPLASVLSLDAGGLVSALQDPEVLDLTKMNFQGVHAVSPSEAWFIGNGISGTGLDGNSYLLHATEEGQTFAVHEFPCEEPDGTPLTSCGFNDIEADDEGRLWLVGESGLVLAEDTSESSSEVSLVGSGGVTEEGNLTLDLDAEEPVDIKNISVDWHPTTSLDWTRSVAIETDAGPVQLWDKDEGGSYIENPLTSHSNKGAARDATLFVDGYTDEVTGDASARTLTGEESLLFGPFRTELEPNALDPDAYFDGAKYDPGETGNLLPLNFTITLDYEDGSHDVFRVWLEEDGTVSAFEETPIDWRFPDEIEDDRGAMPGPSECFGAAENGCNAYLSVNATRGFVGISGVSQADNTVKNGPGDQEATTSDKTQAPLLRLTPDTNSFETVWNSRINQTLRDVTIDPEDPSLWMVVGDGPVLAESKQSGDSWVLLPTGANHLGAPLHAADRTPEIPIVLGGDGEEALRLHVGGHHEEGTADTQDLWDDASLVESVGFDTSELKIRQYRTGEWEAQVHVYDPAHSQESDWVTVYDGTDWVQDPYTFAEPTDELKIRFYLNTTTTGFTVQTPHIQGTLTLDAQPESGPSQEVTIDLTDVGTFDPDSLETVNHNEDLGYLRLEPAQNPWIFRLGNYDAGPWRNNDEPKNYVAPTALGFSPDGEYAYIGTAGIYDSLQSDIAIAHDNTLYKIDVDTGLLASPRGAERFGEPIRDIEVGEDAVFVATSPVGTPGDLTVHTVDQATMQNAVNYDPVDISSNLDDFVMRAYDAAFSNEADDLGAIVKNSALQEGMIHGYKAPTMTQEWEDNPSIEGRFEVTYNVPRNALYGAHVVVTEIEWDIPGTDGLVQTARIHNSFDVTPPTKQISLAPTYNLEVVAWMEDW